MKLYGALMWVRDSDQPGHRLTVLAASEAEAKRKLELEYGGSVIDLHLESDDPRPRAPIGSISAGLR